MPYTITTKDGITINNIPDDVAPDSQSLKDRVASIRAQGGQATNPPPNVGSEPKDEWQKTEYGFRVRPFVTTDTGKPTVEREDGAIYYGPEQGNTGRPGWFRASGRRAGAGTDTTATGITGAVVRGAGPYATGALLGGAAGLAGGPLAPVSVPAGAAAGVASMALTKAIGDPVVSAFNKLTGLNLSTPTETMETAMDYMGIAAPQTGAERVAQTATEAGAGAIGGIGLGRTMQGMASPTTRAIGAQLASTPGQQITGAITGGAASQLAGEAGAGPVGQFVSGLAGGALGAGVASPRTFERRMAMPEIGQAENAGIRVMTSDVLPPETFASKWLQGAGEKLPIVGTGGMRKAQQAQRIDAIRNLLTEYGADDVAKASDEVMKDLLAKRSSDVSKYSGLKRGVITKLSDKGTVPIDRTTAAIDSQIDKLNALKTQEVAPIISRLEDWKGSIQGQNLDNIEMLRAQIGESFKAPEMTASRSLGEKALNAVYGPLREDMGDFIKANGDRTDFTKWKVANSRLSESMGELKNNALKSVLKRGEETPEAIQNMLFSQKPSDVKALVSGLTLEGKQNAKMAVLAKAAQDAGGMDNLSPEKFLSSVNRLGAPIGVVFTGPETQRINGLARALKLTSQAPRAALNPPTGMQAVPIVGTAVLTEMLGGAGAGLATAATLGSLARAYESTPVRNILMALPKVKPGSKEELALFKRLTVALGNTGKSQEGKR